MFRAGASVEQESLSGTRPLTSTPVVKDRKGEMVMRGTDSQWLSCGVLRHAAHRETDLLIQSGTDKMPGEHFKTDAETRWPLDPREGILSSTAPCSQESRVIAVSALDHLPALYDHLGGAEVAYVHKWILVQNQQVRQSARLDGAQAIGRIAHFSSEPGSRHDHFHG